MSFLVINKKIRPYIKIIHSGNNLSVVITAYWPLYLKKINLKRFETTFKDELIKNFGFLAVSLYVSRKDRKIKFFIPFLDKTKSAEKALFLSKIILSTFKKVRNEYKVSVAYRSTGAGK